ncbi:MAG: hypothetical protein RLZZ157_74 [Pseudomonadota bacterium]
MTSIKRNRAQGLTSLGHHPRTFSAMYDAIPESILMALPAKQIAILIDAQWLLASKSKMLAEIEAIENGFVWDHKKDKAVSLKS